MKQLGEAAEVQHISRSRLLETCIEAWLEREIQAQMKEGYRAQAQQMRELADETWDAQRDAQEALD